MSNDVLILERVFKNYGKVEALSGLNLRVSEGEILGLVGPNGAGKTTTLKILSALLKPDAGVVSLDGINVQTDPFQVKKLLGYLPDLPLLYEGFTLFDTIKMYARVWFLQLDKTRALEALDEYGLEPLWNRQVRTLSKGQKQRVSLICALLHEPRILLFDEPFTGLDIESRQFIRNKIEELAATGKTIVVSSHDLADVERLCTRIALIVKGRVAYYGTEDEVRTKALGKVFKIVLGKIPSDLEGLANCTREYSVDGDAVTFTLGEGQSPDEVLKYFIARDCPIRAFEPLGLEEMLLEIIKGEES
jgi:ABC-2 type transport system ATP-binding protein